MSGCIDESDQVIHSEAHGLCPCPCVFPVKKDYEIIFNKRKLSFGKEEWFDLTCTSACTAIGSMGLDFMYSGKIARIQQMNH